MRKGGEGEKKRREEGVWKLAGRVGEEGGDEGGRVWSDGEEEGLRMKVVNV